MTIVTIDVGDLSLVLPSVRAATYILTFRQGVYILRQKLNFLFPPQKKGKHLKMNLHYLWKSLGAVKNRPLHVDIIFI